MASPGDILSALKNGVVNMATLAQSFSRAQGTVTSSAIVGGSSPAATLVYAGSGYLVNFSIISASTSTTSPGTINNAAATTSVSATNALCATPNAIGVFPCNLVFTNGLVVTPAVNQTIAITYYPAPTAS